MFYGRSRTQESVSAMNIVLPMSYANFILYEPRVRVVRIVGGKRDSINAVEINSSTRA